MLPGWRAAEELMHFPKKDRRISTQTMVLFAIQVSAIPFAPANAIESVRSFPGIRLLPDARCGAIAELIRQLDQKY